MIQTSVVSYTPLPYTLPPSFWEWVLREGQGEPLEESSMFYILGFLSSRGTLSPEAYTAALNTILYHLNVDGGLYTYDTESSTELILFFTLLALDTEDSWGEMTQYTQP